VLHLQLHFLEDFTMTGVTQFWLRDFDQVGIICRMGIVAGGTVSSFERKVYKIFLGLGFLLRMALQAQGSFGLR
jgi:hypothetical protein